MGIPGAGSPMVGGTQAVMGFPSVGGSSAGKGGLTPSLAENLSNLLPGGSAISTPGGKPTQPGPIPERPQDVPLTENKYIASLIQNLTNYRPSTQYQQMKEY